MGDLKGVRIKIARAQIHLRALREGLDEFARSKPYSIIAERDAETGDQLFKVADEPAMPPDFPEIGDTLYNLRSALDHLAYQLVINGAAKSAPTTRTSFPIYNDATLFADARAQAKMGGMDNAVKMHIEWYQPCFGRHQHRDQALWSLEEYGNIDKHRHLLTTPISTHDFLWTGGNPVHIHDGPVHKDTVLVRFPAGQEQSQLHAMPSVAFNEPPAAGEEVHRTLYFMHHVVGLIVDDFEARFF